MLTVDRPRHFHLRRLFHRKHSSVVTPILDSPIHETLAQNLRTLNDSLSSKHSLSLHVLSDFLNLLLDTISSASTIFSNPKTPSDPDALESHLTATVPLLDALNAISAEIALLTRSLLPLRLALHLLSKPDALNRARNALKDYDRCPRSQIRLSTTSLANKLANPPPRGAVSPVGTTAYAVEAVSRLVAVAVMSALADQDMGVFECGVSGEWRWAAAFETVRVSICGKGFSGEVKAMEVAAGKLKKAVDGDDGVAIADAAKETENLVAVVMESLDRLSENVNSVFRSVIGLRNTALDCLRNGVF